MMQEGGADRNKNKIEIGLLLGPMILVCAVRVSCPSCLLEIFVQLHKRGIYEQESKKTNLRRYPTTERSLRELKLAASQGHRNSKGTRPETCATNAND